MFGGQKPTDHAAKTNQTQLGTVTVDKPYQTQGDYLSQVMERDVDDICVGEGGKQYYIITPWRYITFKYVKFALCFLMFAALQYSLLIYTTFPLYIVTGIQYHIFVKKIATMNVSARKLKISMAVIAVAEVALCAAVRQRLFGVMFL
jgi:hypothetical protein